jgi:putative membrane protein
MKTFTRFLFSKMLLTILSVTLAFASTSDRNYFTNDKDTTFVADAADAGMLEVQLGKLAASKGSSAEVKKFGENMVTDHTKANDELKQLAQKKGIKVPETLTPKSQKKYEDLSKKTGADFDKAYAELMVKDHQEVIAKFRKQSQTGKDPDLKAWAQNKIPTLEHHHMMAQDMQKAFAKGGQ